jgi:hypothetical protein
LPVKAILSYRDFPFVIIKSDASSLKAGQDSGIKIFGQGLASFFRWVQEISAREKDVVA